MEVSSGPAAAVVKRDIVPAHILPPDGLDRARRARYDRASPFPRVAIVVVQIKRMVIVGLREAWCMPVVGRPTPDLTTRERELEQRSRLSGWSARDQSGANDYESSDNGRDPLHGPAEGVRSHGQENS